MEQFSIVLNQLITFLILMAIGYFAVRRHIVGEAFYDALAQLIMKILLPLLIFSIAISGPTRQDLIESYPILILTLFMYGGLISVFFLLSKLFHFTDDRGKVWQAAFIFGNAGFIGIPLLTSIFPEKGALFIALMSLIDQFILWTYGVHMTTPSSKHSKLSPKKLLNPAIYAIFASIFIIITGIHLPSVLVSGLSTMGKAATPLSLFYLGGLFYFCEWHNVLKSKDLYIGIFFKMILFPLVFYWIASKFCHNQEMVQAMTIISGLPTMTTIAMLTKSQDNQSEYAVGMVLLTTVASLFTISIVSYFIF